MQVWNSTLVSFYLLLDKIDLPELRHYWLGDVRHFIRSVRKGSQMKVIGSLILEESAKAGAGENYESRFLDLRLKVQHRCKTRSRRKISFLIFGAQTKCAKSVQKKEPETNINHNFWMLDKSFKIQWCWMLVCLLTATDVWNKFVFCRSSRLLVNLNRSSQE